MGSAASWASGPATGSRSWPSTGTSSSSSTTPASWAARSSTPSTCGWRRNELSFIIKDSGSRVCFTDAFFAPLVDSVRAEAGIDQVVLIGAGDVPHDVAYEDVVAAGSPEMPPEPDEDDMAILMYTGGTTGLPKGVVLDNRALMLDVYKVATRWSMDERLVYLHQTPMFHAASLGAILAVPAVGGQTTFVPVFQPAAVLDAIERHQVTMTVMVPTMVAMLLDHDDFKPERLALAGDPHLRRLAHADGPGRAGAGDVPRPAALPGLRDDRELRAAHLPGPRRTPGGRRTAALGRPADAGLGAVASRTPSATSCRSARRGEVCARAGNYMREYWNRPEETEAAFRGGWYHTGDAGYLDEDGYVYLVDRVKDMIVTGGENVYSAEVENAISGHPAVAQVAVIGIPSEQWGEAVLAIIVPKAGSEVDEDDIKAWARERIAGYKVPKSIEFRTEPLPLSGAMKVLKRDLRAAYWEGRDRAVQ